jgi:hypothetical protein
VAHCALPGGVGLIEAAEEEDQPVSHLALIITSLVVGAVLAVGATFATAALVTSSVAPANQSAYNYGGNGGSGG